MIDNLPDFGPVVGDVVVVSPQIAVFPEDGIVYLERKYACVMLAGYLPFLVPDKQANCKSKQLGVLIL